MADGATQVAVRERQFHVVQDAIPVLDTGRFEHMQRIATVMAETSLIPETLKGENPRQTLANCFLVVNQATRWGMDPFAVAQCCSVVHGKLTYEGKLVAAVLDAKLGVRLTYKWSGEGERMAIEVSGVLPDGVVESITGTVAEWKTGEKGPWKPATYRKMLAYRGAREWARLYAPAVMLGVYSDDEMEQLSRPPMRDITPPPAPLPAAPVAAVPASRTGPPPAPPAPPSPRRAGPPPAPPPPAEAVPEADAPLADPAALLAHIDDEMTACADAASLDEVWSGCAELMDRLSRSDRAVAEGHYEKHAKRLGAV